MALDKELAKENKEDSAETTLSEEEETDLKIAVTAAEDLIDKGGADVINQALETSSDPGQVVGQFVLQMGQELMSQLREGGIDLSPNIWLAAGGVVEQVMDYLQEEYDVPKEVTDRAEIFIASTIQQMAQAEQQAPAPGQSTAEQAPMPQGGMV